MLSQSTYLPASIIARDIETHFIRHRQAAVEHIGTYIAPLPDAHIIESIIDTAFWTSLRKEEGRSPAISLALLQLEVSDTPMVFEHKLRLTPENLVKLSPAVEQPGIHLGVWPEGDDLFIWGTVRNIPPICFVIQILEPGLVVIKHRRAGGFGKFVNIAVLQGDEIKILDEVSMGVSDCPALLTSLANMPLASYTGQSFNVLVQLAIAMRAHRRGGLVLIVPPGAEWQNSIVHPVKYPVLPSYNAISKLLALSNEEKDKLEWQEALLHAIELIGGFTAIDGATIINQEYDLIAFGAKVTRRKNSITVGEMILTEPVAESKTIKIHPAQHGGTRHLAAAQFVHDQRKAVALVASQDGQFTVYAWSVDLNMVHAHRIDVVLL